VRDIVAHRGNAAEFPENTLESIASAISLGCRFVEFDVQISTDRVPVLMHDGRYFRLTGKDRDSVDTSASGLVSYGHPTLESAATLLAAAPSVTAFVEIKAEAIELHGAEDAVRLVAELLDPSQAVVISFDLNACHIARRLGFRIGAVIADRSAQTKMACISLQPEFTFCDVQLIGRCVPWTGTRWVAYEVESPEMAASLRSRGVELLETMSVRKLLC